MPLLDRFSQLATSLFITSPERSKQVLLSSQLLLWPVCETATTKDNCLPV